MTFTVVCISKGGSVHRCDRRNHADAIETLDEKEQSGIYASGSIFDEDDVEYEGFVHNGKVDPQEVKDAIEAILGKELSVPTQEFRNAVAGRPGYCFG